jgi:hypothetical protein
MKTLLVSFSVLGLLAFQSASMMAQADSAGQAPPGGGRQIDMVAVAEQTNQGVMVTPPTADQPTFYVAYDGGYIEAGDPIAGEKPPTPAVIGQTLRKVLAARGYQPATAPGTASLLLVYHWGSINKEAFAIPSFNRIRPNLKARIYLVAPTRTAATLENYLLSRKAAPNLNESAPVPGFLSPQLRDVLSLAQDDRYFVVVSAYDYAALGRREPTLLWRAKMSARSVSGAMYKVLPALIAGGGRFLGHNLPKARFFKTPLYPFGETAATAETSEPLPAPAVAGQLDAAFISSLVKQEHDHFSGEGVADPAEEGPRSSASAGREPSQSSLPPALTKQITGYRQEKLALQEALAVRIKAHTPGADTREAIDAFNQENAGRIAALAKTREAIRDELARLAAANTDTATAKSLNALLREFAADVQQLEPPSEAAAK